MPATAKTLTALRAALKDEYERVDRERARMLETTGQFSQSDYVKLLGKAEGLLIARRLVEGLCQ